MARSGKKPSTRSAAKAPAADELARYLELLGSVRQIMHALDVRSRSMSSASRITLPQLLCLMAVVAEEKLTSRQIGRRIHVSASTLVGVLDRLEAKDWIKRIRDPRDRRQVHIVPTAAGRKLIRAAPSPFGEAFDEAFGALSVAGQKRLVENVALMANLMAGEKQTS